MSININSDESATPYRAWAQSVDFFGLKATEGLLISVHITVTATKTDAAVRLVPSPILLSMTGTARAEAERPVATATARAPLTIAGATLVVFPLPPDTKAEIKNTNTILLLPPGDFEEARYGSLVTGRVYRETPIEVDALRLEKLPLGSSQNTEACWIKFARRRMRALRDFQYDDDPNQTKIFVVPRDSALDQERLPQVRISVGDASTLNAAFELNRNDFRVNERTHTLIYQGMVVFEVYARLHAEARDLADWLRDGMYTSLLDLGRCGIFGFDGMVVTEPQPVQAGGRYEGAFVSRFAVSFNRHRPIRVYNERSRIFNGLTLGLSYDPRIQRRTDDTKPVLTRIDRPDPRTIKMTFSEEVGPYLPEGFYVFSGNRRLTFRAQRSYTDFTRIDLVLDETPLRPNALDLFYRQGDLVGVGFTSDELGGSEQFVDNFAAILPASLGEFAASSLAVPEDLPQTLS